MRAYQLVLIVFAFVLLATVCSSSAVGQQGPATPSPEPSPLTKLPSGVLDAKLKSARGGSFRLSDYSGKVLVVNLWATWVGPSRLETPELVKVQAHFWSQGVRVVGLSTENPEVSAAEVREWVRSHRVQYRTGWATPEVATTLMQGRDVVPQTFVISRSGRIVRRFVGFNSTVTPGWWKEAIEEALNEKPDASEQH